jgi:hypothetical protein
MMKSSPLSTIAPSLQFSMQVPQAMHSGLIDNDIHFPIFWGLQMPKGHPALPAFPVVGQRIHF